MMKMRVVARGGPADGNESSIPGMPVTIEWRRFERVGLPTTALTEQHPNESIPTIVICEYRLTNEMDDDGRHIATFICQR